VLLITKIGAHEKCTEKRAKEQPKEVKKVKTTEKSSFYFILSLHCIRANPDEQKKVDEYIPPHAILFVQKIPAGTSEETLTSLFQQYVFF
jgi:hypothetical protein